MSAQLEVFPDIDSQPNQPTIASVYKELIDIPNAQREARQLSQITSNELSYDNEPYWLTTYMPTDGLRTWRDAENQPVLYPHILLSHGVASDSRYFDSLFHKLNKLGIGCSAITLPRHQGLPDADTMLNWHSGALAHAHDFIQANNTSRPIILGGHSRGAIVAINALEQLTADDPSYSSAGLLLLAPAGLERLTPLQMAKAALNLGPLALNSFHHAENVRQLGHYATMIMQTIAQGPAQTAIESYQALNTHVGHKLYDTFKDVSVLITAAEFDEFVDYQQMLNFAKFAPHANIALASLDTNHMLGERRNGDIISLADPRLLTGQILAWLQSQTTHYHPLIVRSDRQTAERI